MNPAIMTEAAAATTNATFTAAEKAKLEADVEAYCQEIRPIEEIAYLERRFNPAISELAKKHNLLGMSMPKQYGGRGADSLTYTRALVRINKEGTGVRTFFSGHCSIGQFPIAVATPDGVYPPMSPLLAGFSSRDASAFGVRIV